MTALATQIRLTLAVAGRAVIPVIADLNRTHATNPLRDPRARFHVVWQVSSSVGMALVRLGLIRAGPPGGLGPLLAAGLAA